MDHQKKNQKTDQKPEVIIVGAGPGGLSAAIILANRGCDVTLLEKSDVVGGRNAPLKLGNYIFDTGPTFLMMPFILEDIFTEAGRKLDDYLELKLLDPMYRLIFKELTLSPTYNSDDMKKQLEAIEPGNGAGYDRFLKREKKRFKRLFPCLRKPYTRWYHLMRGSVLKALPHLSLGRSMHQELGNYFSTEDLKISFTFQSKYLGMSPWNCPALFNMIPYVEHRYGIYHVTGGLNAISLAMEKVARELGVKIKKSCTVKNLLREGKNVQGVLLENGERLGAEGVFINADFGYAATELMKPLKKYTPEHLDTLNLSCSIFMIYLGVKKRYDIPHHNIFFSDHYRENVFEIFHGKKLSTDSSFYIQNASVTDPTVAPEGCSTIYILVPVPNLRGEINWAEERERFKEQIIDQVIKKTELKDLREHIEVSHTITPDEWQHDYNVYQGAVFNLGHNMKQMLYFRPRNKFEELNNCYLVGGGTHPGSGLPTIYESALISANLFCKKHKLPHTKPPESPPEPFQD